MSERYIFRAGEGFPNLLVRPNALNAATLTNLREETSREYSRLVGLGLVSSDYIAYIGEKPYLDSNRLLSTPLTDVKDNGKLKVEKVYWESGLSGSIEQTLVRVEVLRRLKLAANKLPEEFGLVLLDGWRSHQSQENLYKMHYLGESKLAEGFVSPPSTDPQTPPPHTTGGTVDVTLSFQGIPLGLGTGYDEFSERAFAMAKPDAKLEAASGITELEWQLRRILYSVMYESEFVVLPEEWWHFEYGTRLWSAATHRPALFGRIERDGTLYLGNADIENNDADTKVLIQADERPL